MQFFLFIDRHYYHDVLGKTEVEDVNDVLERQTALCNVCREDNLPLVRPEILEYPPKNGT